MGYTISNLGGGEEKTGRVLFFSYLTTDTRLLKDFYNGVYCDLQKSFEFLVR